MNLEGAPGGACGGDIIRSATACAEACGLRACATRCASSVLMWRTQSAPWSQSWRHVVEAPRSTLLRRRQRSTTGPHCRSWMPRRTVDGLVSWRLAEPVAARRSISVGQTDQSKSVVRLRSSTCDSVTTLSQLIGDTQECRRTRADGKPWPAPKSIHLRTPRTDIGRLKIRTVSVRVRLGALEKAWSDARASWPGLPRGAVLPALYRRAAGRKPC